MPSHMPAETMGRHHDPMSHILTGFGGILSGYGWNSRGMKDRSNTRLEGERRGKKGSSRCVAKGEV